MIFCHNTYNRPKTTLETILKEKKLYPDAKFILVYNSKNIDVSILENNNVYCFYFGDNKGHKFGSINAVYSCLKLAYDIAEDNEDIIFSHGDTYLSNNEKFKICLHLLKKHKFVSRRYIGNKHCDVNHYIMMESFLIKKGEISNFIKGYNHNEINELPLDKMGSECPEQFFGQDVLKYIKNPYLFDITENEYGENIMGYYHIENIRGSGDKEI